MKNAVVKIRDFMWRGDVEKNGPVLGIENEDALVYPAVDDDLPLRVELQIINDKQTVSEKELLNV